MKCIEAGTAGAIAPPHPTLEIHPTEPRRRLEWPKNLSKSPPASPPRSRTASPPSWPQEVGKAVGTEDRRRRSRDLLREELLKTVELN